MNFGEIYPCETIFGRNGIIRQAFLKSFDFSLVEERSSYHFCSHSHLAIIKFSSASTPHVNHHNLWNMNSLNLNEKYWTSRS